MSTTDILKLALRLESLLSVAVTVTPLKLPIAPFGTTLIVPVPSPLSVKLAKDGRFVAVSVT